MQPGQPPLHPIHALTQAHEPMPKLRLGPKKITSLISGPYATASHRLPGLGAPFLNGNNVPVRTRQGLRGTMRLEAPGGARAPSSCGRGKPALWVGLGGERSGVCSLFTSEPVAPDHRSLLHYKAAPAPSCRRPEPDAGQRQPGRRAAPRAVTSISQGFSLSSMMMSYP